MFEYALIHEHYSMQKRQERKRKISIFYRETSFCCFNVALLCVRGVRKIFSMSDDAKRVRERSFLNEPQASSEKIFLGRVWHHHELEISFGRQEHTVKSLLFKLFANLTRKIVKSMHFVKKCHLMRHFFVWRWRQNLSIGID